MMKRVELFLEGQHFTVKAELIKNIIWFNFKGFTYTIPKKTVPGPAKKTLQKKEFKNQILSPMPGRIVKILVSLQQTVQENQALLILSSMKMEYTLKAPGQAIVQHIAVEEQDTVSADQELIKLLPVGKKERL